MQIDKDIPIPPQAFNAGRAAAYLGMSRASFYRFVVGNVKTIKYGTRTMYPRAELDKFMKDCA